MKLTTHNPQHATHSLQYTAAEMILQLLTIAGALNLCAWLYLCLGHGRFWNIGRHVPPAAGGGSEAVSIAVIIPARNEREGIGRSLRSPWAGATLAPLALFL